MYVTGKTGDLKPNSILHVNYESKFCSGYLSETLQTDSNGTVELGMLSNAISVTVENVKYPLPYPAPLWNLPRFIHSESEKTILIPWIFGEASVEDENVALYSVNHESVSVEDFSSRISLKEGFLQFSLAVGKYKLCIGLDIVDIRVIKKVSTIHDFVCSKTSALQLPNRKPLQFQVDKTKTSLKINVQNSTPNTRLHGISQASSFKKNPFYCLTHFYFACSHFQFLLA